MSAADSIPIWDRIAAPAFTQLRPAAARALLRMKFRSGDVRRIHQLSSLAKKGALDEAQRGELDLYLQIGHVLTLMHSKARMALKPPESRRRRKSA
jgi:hypothetical protein